MNDFISAIILGIVEGLTEFLPISSTGHLIIANEFFSFEENFTLMFNIVIQMGAILAVIFYFWKMLWPFSENKENNKKAFELWQKAIIGVLPAVAIGALFASKIEEIFFNTWSVAIVLVVGGLIILWLENSKKEPKIHSVYNLSYKTILLIGLIQCFAMIPGTSRAGATIIGAMMLGASRVVATEFSFFLAIPTLFSASMWSIIKYWQFMDLSQLYILATGFAVSFIIALIVIKFLMNYIQIHNFKVFGWYRIALGLIIIIFFLIK